MRKLYTNQDNLMVGFLRGILESHGIRCITKNEHLMSGVGQLPPIECWPELWVTDDEEYYRAKELVSAELAGQQEVRPNWRCRHCGEEIEGQFTHCWNCGMSAPET